MILQFALGCAGPEGGLPAVRQDAARSAPGAAWITDGAMEVQEDASWTHRSCSCGDSGSGEWLTTVVASDLRGELRVDDGTICAWSVDRLTFAQHQTLYFGSVRDEVAVERASWEGFGIEAGCPVQDDAWMPQATFVNGPRAQIGDDLWLFGIPADQTAETRTEELGDRYEHQDAWTTVGESHRWWRLDPLLTGPPVPARRPAPRRPR